MILPAVPLVPATGEPDGIPQIPCSDPRGCPDLAVDAGRMASYTVSESTFSASSCAVREDEVPAPGTWKLLRWTFTTPNFGDGDLIVGAPSQHPEWFTYSSCHQHYHFREYADYRLWSPSDGHQWELFRRANPDMTAKEALAANPDLKPLVGDKAGFCVIDIVRYPNAPGARWNSCSQRQGITTGWADEYSRSLDGQWIVVNGVPPGLYLLENEVNAERLYEETSYANNRAYVLVNIK